MATGGKKESPHRPGFAVLGATGRQSILDPASHGEGDPSVLVRRPGTVRAWQQPGASPAASPPTRLRRGSPIKEAEAALAIPHGEAPPASHRRGSAEDGLGAMQDVDSLPWN